MTALHLDEIQQRLGDGFSISHYSQVTSTNDLAMELARNGAPTGTIVSADFQSAGRGRLGAPWVAPAESSVLMSVVFRPKITLPPSHLAILSGVGVAHALRALDVPAQIKWPNDILVQDRKVAGILVETTGDAVVVGVGVNCAIDEFPAELGERAGSLHALMGRPFPREEVLLAVARELTTALERVESGGIIRVLYAWNTMNWYGRRKVRVSGPFGVVEGDGLFLDGHQIIWHVFRDGGVVAMPLNSSVQAI